MRGRSPSAPATRVGLFGLLGSGNIGNDASMEAVLRSARNRHPAVAIDAMCSGPGTVTERYGIDAVQMFCFDRYQDRFSGPVASLLRLPSRVIDVFRIAAWARRHDAVIVPGMGVLEASLPLRPWNMPYGLFVLSAAGRLFGTKVLFVCVGAAPIEKRATCWLSTRAAKLASYRSFRDQGSREAMRQRGLEATDPVYPDLAFSLPPPPAHIPGAGDWKSIGVGLMGYAGSNDERDRSDEIHANYVSAMASLVRWLVDNGRRVRLFIGDTDGSDTAVVREILHDVRATRPGLDESAISAVPVSTFDEIREAMEPLGAVIATRYHNLIAALTLSKPTIAVGYSPKHEALMASAGLSEFSHPIRTLDVGRLTEQFLELERRGPQLQQELVARNASAVELLDRQFGELDELVYHEAPRSDDMLVRSGKGSDR